MADAWVEPGRSVASDGRITYAWPPEGRFASLWDRFCAAFPDDDDRGDLLALLARWLDDNSTLAGFTDENGEWVDVTWPWEES